MLDEMHAIVTVWQGMRSSKPDSIAAYKKKVRERKSNNHSSFKFLEYSSAHLSCNVAGFNLLNDSTYYNMIHLL